MRMFAALLLVAGCNAEKPPETTSPRAGTLPVDVAGPVKQSPGKIPKPGADTNATAAAIMKGGFLPDGSFVHGDHIHAPGQEKCPSEMNGGPVQ